MSQMNEQFGFEREPLPEFYEADLVDVDAQLADALTLIEVPEGLEDRVFAASVRDLPQEAVPAGGYSFVHVLRTRWISSGRLAMAACLGLVCVVGSWMLHAHNASQNQLASNSPKSPLPTIPTQSADTDNGAVMLASLEKMSSDSVSAADGGWLWMDYARQEISVDDLDQELSAMMKSLGAGDEM
ncbi:MAG TPA: hypothetical protein VG711_06345 [Phycisphaerales bacterium]|nr:hypothetical protein [Phycisphaerales bacterium]